MSARIRISDATGSRHFKPLLIRQGCKVCLRSLRKMPFGDFWFWGNGPSGRVKVGIERKTVTEIVGEIGDNRFTGHQLPGMTKAFGYRYLIIEGRMHVDRRSGLLNPKSFKFLPNGSRSHMFRTVMKFELTIANKGGMRIIHTENEHHTTEVIAALASWFDEPWSKHKSVYQVEEDKIDNAMLAPRTMKRKVANQLSGMAWTRSAKADAYFPSIASMTLGDPNYRADVETIVRARHHWQTALGFKDGKVIAAKIVDVCHRRDDQKAKGK